MKKVTNVLLLFLLVQFSILAQDVLFEDLEGIELLQKVVEEYKPISVLWYSEAKDVMYGDIYNEQDSVSCVYSGHTLHLPKGVDPSIHLYMGASSDGINAEHTYPRSKGASEENELGFSDLHNLFPTRYAINTARSNFPFGDIADTQTTSWYFENKKESSVPTAHIDHYSERINGMFEPREDHKGNVARAMFYFYTMYEDYALEADPDFFEEQRATLCFWHQQDPADDKEVERTFKIARYQEDKPNPFVVDCSLANRTYCQEFNFSCAFLTTPTEDVQLNEIELYPNPISDVLNVSIEGQQTARVYDMTGRQLVVQDFVNKATLDFQSLASGTYLVTIDEQVFKVVK